MSRNSQIYTIAGILAVLTVCVVIITVMVASCSREPSEPVSVSPESESSSSEEEPEEAIVDEEDDEEDSSEESSQASSSSTIIYYPSSTPTTTTGTASGSSGTGSSSSSSSSSSVKAAVLSKAGTVRNQTYSTLTIKSSVGDGNVRLENVKLTKQLVINGSDRVELVNCTIPEIVVDNEDETVSLIAKGKTKVNSVVIYTHANLWEEDLSSGYEGFQKVSTKTGRGYTRLKVGLYDTDLDSFRAGELTALSRHNSTVESYLLSSNLVSNSSGSSSSKSRYMNLDVDDISLDEGEEYEIDVYVEKESNGDDLSGVRVTASVRSGGSHVRLTDSSDTTDKDGYAVIKVRARERGAGDARIRITAKKSGYTTEYKTIDVSVGELDLQSLLNQAANSTNKTVTLTRSYTVSSLTVPSGVTLKIPNTYTLTVSNGTMTNNGTVTVNSGGTLTVGSGASLVNNGTISNGGAFQVGGALTNNGSITGNGVTGMNTSATLAMGSNGTLSGTIVYLNGTQETDCQGKTYTWNGTAWNRTDTPSSSATVSTLQELKNALNDSNITTIEVTGAITLDNTVTSLNKTINITQQNCCLLIPSGSTVTINGNINGAVMGTDNTSKLILNGTLTGSNWGETPVQGTTYFWESDKWSPVVDTGSITTAEQLQEALKQSDSVTVTKTIDLTSGLTVDSGKTVTVASGSSLIVPAGSTLTVNGRVEGSIVGPTASLTRSAGTANLTIGSNGSLSGTTVYKNDEPESAYQGQTYTWDGSRWNRKVEEESSSQPQPTAEETLKAALAVGNAATSEEVALTGTLTVPAGVTLTVNHPITGYAVQGGEGAKLVVNRDGSVVDTTFQDGFGATETVLIGKIYTWNGAAWQRELDAAVTVDTAEKLATALSSPVVTSITTSTNLSLSTGLGAKSLVVGSGTTLTISGSVSGSITGQSTTSSLKVSTDGSLADITVYDGFGTAETVCIDKTYGWNGSSWQRPLEAAESVTTLVQLRTALGTAHVTQISISGSFTGNDGATEITIPAGKTVIVTSGVSLSIPVKGTSETSKLKIEGNGTVSGTFYYIDKTPKGTGVSLADTYTWTEGKWVGTASAPEAPVTEETSTIQETSAAPAGEETGDTAGKQVYPNPEPGPGLA